MSDLSLALNRATGQSSASSASAVASAAPATVADPPRDLLRLPPGHLLHGQVLGRNAQGETLVRSNEGLLRLLLPQSFPKGTELAIEIRSSGTRLQVLVLHASTPPSGKSVPVSGNVNLPGQLGQSRGTAPLLAVGQNLSAIVQSPASGLAASNLAGTNATSPLAAGNTVTLRLLGLGVPTTALQNGTTVPQNPPSARGSIGLSSNSAITTQSGHALALQLRSLGPKAGAALGTNLALGAPNGGKASAAPFINTAGTNGGSQGSFASAIPPAAGTQVFTAQVITTNAQGQHLLLSPLGTLSMELRAGLPLGTSLTLQLRIPAATAAEAATRPDAAGNRAGSLGQPWPALQELSKLESQSLLPTGYDPKASLPQTGPKLTTGIVFFLAALKGSALATWMAPHSAWLPKLGRADLLERLSGDMARHARLPEVAGEWRILTLPFLHGPDLQHMRLLLRREPEQEDAGRRAKRPSATRFLVECKLTRLGDLQLDGLIQPKQFDLIFRSQRALAAHQQSQITQIFQNTVGAAGLGGRIAFEAGHVQSHAPNTSSARLLA